MTLQPLAASRCRSPLRVDLDLARTDGQLTLGDLRLAAERSEEAGRFESAHRLWTAVGRAASGIDDLDLWNYADRRAADAIESATLVAGEQYRRASVRHDYEAIAAARSAGASFQAVAAAHGCSISTARRAVDHIARRDEALAADPELAQTLLEGADASRLVEQFGLDRAFARWLVASQVERRSRRG